MICSADFVADGSSCVLLDRYDLAEAILDRIGHYRNPDTGGVRLWRDPSAPTNEDWLLTAQVGLVSVLLGDSTAREETYEWFQRVWAAQPRLNDQVLYTAWDDDGLILDPETAGPTGIVDMTKPLQMYFQPGGAAAFIAQYAAQTRDAKAVDFARDLLMLNVNGTLDQLTDERSIHVCKFPWGAAEIIGIDPQVDWTPDLVRMATWFSDRQEVTGAWSPSAFTLSAPPTDVDRLWKTAEHVMEVEKMIVGLESRNRRPGWVTTD